MGVILVLEDRSFTGGTTPPHLFPLDFCRTGDG